jgi:hypothetical protein
MTDQHAALVAKLRESLKAWDDAYITVLDDSIRSGIKATEEKLKVAARNEMRRMGVELPEIVRWELRAAIGFRSEEE